MKQAWRIAGGVLALFIVAAAGGAAARADAPAVQTIDRNPGVERLEREAARMYDAVKKPHPGELKWQQIPWLSDLRQAMRQARAEGRPLMRSSAGCRRRVDDPRKRRQEAGPPARVQHARRRRRTAGPGRR